jgi:uncharacterized protein (DUF1330 family)
MPDKDSIYISSCDTHNVLFAEARNFKYLEGFLLSARYIYSDEIAPLLLDRDKKHESKGTPIERVISHYRQAYGEQPWLICDQCAKLLPITPNDLILANDAARRRLHDPSEQGHAPEKPCRQLGKGDTLVIAYASRLVPTAAEMATLALFYDEIWLPHPCDLLTHGAKNLASLYRQLTGDCIVPGLQAAQEIHGRKREHWKPLFDEGILRTMPPFELFGGLFRNRDAISIEDFVGWFARIPKEAELFSTDAQHLESFVLAMHRLDAKKLYPELFISDPNDRSTARLSGLLHNQILTCRIPEMQGLNSEQILELRQLTKIAKQGYRQYLNQLSDDLEQRLATGNTAELETASKIAERKVIPEYEQYVKQMKKQETRFGAKFLEASGKFMQIDASVWTPKFWGALIEIFSSTLYSAVEQDQDRYLSNERQAFHYLATLQQNRPKAN